MIRELKYVFLHNDIRVLKRMSLTACHTKNEFTFITTRVRLYQ
jgi:hypothetical protein